MANKLAATYLAVLDSVLEYVISISAVLFELLTLLAHGISLDDV
jgi:hypothetical protein